MKSLYQYILQEEEVATPANTMGMGDVNVGTEPLVSAPAGGIPGDSTRVFRRRKRRRNREREFVMTTKSHNT